MIGTLLAAGALSILGPETVPEFERCGVDAIEAERLLALDSQSFDADPEAGWRAIAQRDGCFGVAAEMITLYLVASTALPQPDIHTSSLLRWHAGQMQAMAGNNEAAIAHFRGAYEATDPADHSTPGWNAYVDATIAFLEDDRRVLLDANERLTAQGARDRYRTVTGRMVACLGRPYRDVLLGTCESATPE